MRANISEDALPFLRRRLQAMLGEAPVNAKMIAENIAFGAAVLGSGHVELVDRNGWWFVASEFNWLAPMSERSPHASEQELFERMVRFPEQSATAHRAEIYVAAFAKTAYYRVAQAATWIRGEARSPLPDSGVTPPWCDTVLGFSLSASA